VMNRILSNATNRIDAKGRVSVPSMFRAGLARAAVDELCAWQAFEFLAVWMAGPAVLDRFERPIGSPERFTAEATKTSLMILGGGVFMKLDGEGRLLVTDFIRDFTGITDRVTFAGRGDHFQLWEPAAFEEMQSRARKERTASS